MAKLEINKSNDFNSVWNAIERLNPNIVIETLGTRNGYMELNEILMLQWGITASITLSVASGEYDYNNVTVTYNPRFETAPTVISCFAISSTPGVSAGVGTAPTATTVLLQASINLPAHPANTTCQIAWIAIGIKGIL